MKRLLRRFRELFQAASSIAVSILIGSLCTANLAAQAPPRWEVGPIISSTPFRMTNFDERSIGVGGRILFNAQKNVAGELQGSFYDEVYTSEGYGAHAAAHVKLTLRHEKSGFNVFAIAGPGYMREQIYCCGGHARYMHWTSLIWDVGGGIEVIGQRKFGVRLDFKDLIQTTYCSCGGPGGRVPGFDFTIGAMFRFH